MIRHSVPAANRRRSVSVKVAEGERLSENARARRGGQANRNADLRARTDSLNRTVNTERGDIDTDTTRGAASADADDGTNFPNHPVPPATDTPSARPNGPASAAAATCLHRLLKR